jgi:hypothetical protein
MVSLLRCRQEAAALAYDIEAARVFGEYARLNFPEGR